MYTRKNQIRNKTKTVDFTKKAIRVRWVSQKQKNSSLYI